MRDLRVRRMLAVCVSLGGMVFAVGCGRAPSPEIGAEGSVEAKQEWQSAQARGEFDQLRNRLMHSQTDR